MAKVTIINTEPQQTDYSQSMWKVSLLGLGLGFIYWAISLFIEFWVINQFFCSNSATLICQNATNVSGNIAIILTAFFGILIMVRFRMVQPLIVSIASAIVLWGVSAWTNGLAWYEILVCDLIFYLLAYALFSWIVRCKKLVVALIVCIVIIILLYIVLSL